MTGVNHFAAGALIATVTVNPWVAVPAAFFSHVVLDAMPHFGRSSLSRQRLMIVIDACLLLLLAGLVWGSGNTLAMVCGVVALALDALWIPMFLAEQRGKQYVFNRLEHLLHVIQWGERPWGWVLEAAYFGLIMSLLLPRL
ncbi:hypothetical protein CR970_03235 [Candidatus Saccharibacteria bacterium]|nr:MAG: hypothetical protein CR970_03235 [Candidatus Saccharibacteria bacterium]